MEPTPALYLREEGTGSPIVLIHGLGGDHTVWNSVIPLLARRHRVLAPDLKGHGQSSAPAGAELTFPQLRTDILDILDRRHIASAHLVGLSAGGFLAIDLAIERPERVLSLFLIGSGAHVDARTRAVAERWGEVYAQEGADAFALRLAKDLLSPEWLEQNLDYLDELREKVRRRDYRGAALWGRALREFDRRPQIGRIRAPTFLMHGMDDGVVDASHPRLVRQTILGAEIRLLPGAGHLLPVERAKETAETIEAFVTKVDGAAPAAHSAPPAEPSGGF